MASGSISDILMALTATTANSIYAQGNCTKVAMVTVDTAIEKDVPAFCVVVMVAELA